MMPPPRRVLVVDDDDDLRASVAMALEDEGWQVGQARHGAEALDLLATFRPSIMTLDWRMPVMDGAAVLARLATWAPPRQVPVVLVSAGDTAAVASRYGLKHFLRKPFGVEDLLLMLERALASAATGTRGP